MKTREQILQEAYRKGFEKGAQAVGELGDAAAYGVDAKPALERAQYTNPGAIRRFFGARPRLKSFELQPRYGRPYTVEELREFQRRHPRAEITSTGAAPVASAYKDQRTFVSAVDDANRYLRGGIDKITGPYAFRQYRSEDLSRSYPHMFEADNGDLLSRSRTLAKYHQVGDGALAYYVPPLGWAPRGAARYSASASGPDIVGHEARHAIQQSSDILDKRLPWADRPRELHATTGQYLAQLRNAGTELTPDILDKFVDGAHHIYTADDIPAAFRTAGDTASGAYFSPDVRQPWRAMQQDVQTLSNPTPPDASSLHTPRILENAVPLPYGPYKGDIDLWRNLDRRELFKRYAPGFVQTPTRDTQLKDAYARGFEKGAQVLPGVLIGGGIGALSGGMYNTLRRRDEGDNRSSVRRFLSGAALGGLAGGGIGALAGHATGRALDTRRQKQQRQAAAALSAEQQAAQRQLFDENPDFADFVNRYPSAPDLSREVAARQAMQRILEQKARVRDSYKATEDREVFRRLGRYSGMLEDLQDPAYSRLPELASATYENKYLTPDDIEKWQLIRRTIHSLRQDPNAELQHILGDIDSEKYLHIIERLRHSRSPDTILAREPTHAELGKLFQVWRDEIPRP